MNAPESPAQPEPRHQPDQPEQPAQPAEQPAATETVLGQTTVTMRRSPRYFNFMLLGAAIGVLGALVGTVAFPENKDFGQAQVFGFLLLVGVAGGVALGALVALVIDRVIGRSSTAVLADRLGVQESRTTESDEVSSDTHQSTQHSADQP